MNTNPSTVIQKLALSPDSPQESQLLAVLGKMLDDVKFRVDSYVNAFDIHLCPPEYLPYLAATIGVSDEYPYMASIEEQRRFVSYVFEANNYKGTEYSLYLLLRGIFNLDTVSIREGYKYCLMTYRRGNGWNGGTTYTTRLSGRVKERISGLPTDARMYHDRYKPNNLFINITAELSQMGLQMNTKFNIAQSLVRKYVPEVVDAYFSVSGYTSTEVVSMPSDFLKFEELDVAYIINVIG